MQREAKPPVDCLNITIVDLFLDTFEYCCVEA